MSFQNEPPVVTDGACGTREDGRIMHEILSSVRKVRDLVGELHGVVPKVNVGGLRLGELGRLGKRFSGKKGFWLLLLLALVAWWFWERDRKAKPNAPPVLKN
jgi:hypothetical protein